MDTNRRLTLAEVEEWAALQHAADALRIKHGLWSATIVTEEVTDHHQALVNLSRYVGTESTAPAELLDLGGTAGEWYAEGHQRTVTVGIVGATERREVVPA